MKVMSSLTRVLSLAVKIEEVCTALGEGNRFEAERLLANECAWSVPESALRRNSPVTAVRIFVRDSFIDRYSGERVVFPPVLRLISASFPKLFPVHPNWKATATHPAYWQLAATVDHVVPVTRGGPDDESNMITTSMERNLAKSNFLLEEVGWRLRDIGATSNWDGLLHWFVNYARQNQSILEAKYFRTWLAAATRVVAV